MKRIFLVILDGLGVGAMPDAAAFGDVGANTLRSVTSHPNAHISNLLRMGLGNIDGVDFLPREAAPTAAVGRLAELSPGKDTTVGHWEIAGVVSKYPLPTYQNGFPSQVIAQFSAVTGRKMLCNRPYSGTAVIADYGEEHMRTGDLIVYTSADSVFQIAAHEEVVPLEQLYEYCRIAREILVDEHGVGRVIARPFVGEPGAFTRTENRRDFSLLPPEKTILDILSAAGLDVITIGKVDDIFAGQGITKRVKSKSNREAMDKLNEQLQQDFGGLCFCNLVDFDMLYGHRRDVGGFARALSEFDAWIPTFIKNMRAQDILILTSDHGCDPAFPGNDHTREYAPLVVVGQSESPQNLGTRSTFADVAATIAEYFDLDFDTPGSSFLNSGL